MDSAAVEDQAREQEPPPGGTGPARPGDGNDDGNGRGWLKFGGAVLGVLVLAVATVLVWPAARVLVRQSFTQQTETYTELYFVGTPGLRSGTVTAEVALVRHGSGPADYTVVASLETASADSLAGVPRHVTLQPGQPTTLAFTLTVPAGRTVDALTVNVADSPDSPDSLRFRLPGATSPTGGTS